jgi:predicted acetylornithine/succinylornithine family transaminase
VLERGNGVYLFDTDGERYLDCVSGLAVNALGYGDYEVIEAIRQQSGRLIHVSNLYHTIPGALLAEQLVTHSCADRVFLCNSGTEANEACLKFARRWARTHYGDDKYELVAAYSSFHGRTMGSISLTGQEKYQAPFEPLVPGVKFAPYNDIERTLEQITDKTAAVFLEPIQAEGGVHPAKQEYLNAVREACDKHHALLVFDEVQVGLGRTGYLFCYERYGVEPDMLTLAKPLAGGMPIGAALLKQHVADAIKPGDHAATFGGGPLICAAALAVFHKIADSGLLETVRKNAAIFEERLCDLQKKHPAIKEIRGMGMIWGIQFGEPVAPMVAEFRKRHILACVAGPNVLRFLPPLVIGEEHLHQVADTFDAILSGQ